MNEPLHPDDVIWPDEAHMDGHEVCRGCEGELKAGQVMVPINQMAFVHYDCLRRWFDNEGGRVRFKLKDKPKTRPGGLSPAMDAEAHVRAVKKREIATTLANLETRRVERRAKIAKTNLEASRVEPKTAKTKRKRAK